MAIVNAERQVTILNELGLHARPAAELVKLAGLFKSEIRVMKDGDSVNGKSIMGVMTLAAEQGSTLKLRFDGPDENEAAAAITELFERGFDEY